MRPRIKWIVAAALLAAVSSAAMAAVVRDRIGNPGVQSGGHALPSHVAPPVPYSLIGAIAQSATWPWQSATWPWQFAAWPWQSAAWPWQSAAWPWRHAAWPWLWFTSFHPHHRSPAKRPHPPY